MLWAASQPSSGPPRTVCSQPLMANSSIIYVWLGCCESVDDPTRSCAS